MNRPIAAAMFAVLPALAFADGKPNTASSNRTLKVSMTVLDTNDKTLYSPIVLAAPGQPFGVRIGNPTQNAAGAWEFDGLDAKCLPEIEAADSLTMDCAFSTSEHEGEVRKNRSMKVKLRMNMGKAASLVIGDNGGPEKLRVNLLADWAPAP